MATIYHVASAGALGTSTSEFGEMQTRIGFYWGDITAEKIFPIPFWRVLQMLSVSPSEQIALHITDFNNVALVDAEWVVYNDDLEELLESATRPHEYYFVMHESFFEDLRDSIPSIGNPVRELMLWGRLGKETENGSDYIAFFVAAKGNIFGDPGSGGDGASTGFKIPPPQ